jgi:hypothetical protein
MGLCRIRLHIPLRMKLFEFVAYYPKVKAFWNVKNVELKFLWQGEKLSLGFVSASLASKNMIKISLL